MKPVSVRNLEYIQEDTRARGPRFGTLLLASLGGGALVLTAMMTMERQQPSAVGDEDALGQLVLQAQKHKEVAPERVRQDDVSFPGLLSDEPKPSTVLAAVKDERGRLVEQTPEPPAGSAPQGADALPSVPLPAGNLLESTKVTQEPQDALTQLAAEKASVGDGAPLAEAGAEGGFQIQVASFQKQGEAEEFVRELRQRGHHAYRQAAYVANRGLWHRVRIGPFKTSQEAAKYKSGFEKKEQMSTFLVDPEKVKRQQDARDAKLAVRIKKYGKP